MNTYEYHSDHFNCKCRVSFNAHGVITSMVFEDHDTTETKMERLYVPVHEKKFLDICAMGNKPVTLIPPDLSFTRFWNRYNYKDGPSKSKAEAAWNKLNDTDKAQALLYIPRYENHLKLNQVARAYPETYLNQRRWVR
jgi:hypothetical protein